MIKTDELSNPDSCLNKAKPFELLFVLLERDPAAPLAIRAWANERVRLGKNTIADAQIREALACADKMEGHTKQPCPNCFGKPGFSLPGMICNWCKGLRYV